MKMGLTPRVSQKTPKSEFWNVTYPSGFHSCKKTFIVGAPKYAPKYAKYGQICQICIFGCIFGRAQYGQVGCP